MPPSLPLRWQRAIGIGQPRAQHAKACELLRTLGMFRRRDDKSGCRTGFNLHLSNGIVKSARKPDKHHMTG